MINIELENIKALYGSGKKKGKKKEEEQKEKEEEEKGFETSWL